MAIALRLVEDAQGTHQRGDVMHNHQAMYSIIQNPRA